MDGIPDIFTLLDSMIPSIMHPDDVILRTSTGIFDRAGIWIVDATFTGTGVVSTRIATLEQCEDMSG